ncbi:hypothetical protein GCM10010400_69880 [Streptomyces aculeolatus]|uniref:hypothetical protein n=1 Tax=Streptomyces aculeolatus TaxID=270689 RepID=UPI001CED4FF6|nr:hypothetical protein [Streptomyces aculeolatus]
MTRLRLAVYCLTTGATATALAATAALTVDDTGTKRAVWAGVLLAVAGAAGVRRAVRQ